MSYLIYYADMSSDTKKKKTLRDSNIDLPILIYAYYTVITVLIGISQVGCFICTFIDVIAFF